jgi:hypothetical protein
MNALKIGDQVGLAFTTVMNHVPRGMVDEDEEINEITDRAYWESRGSKKTVAMADELLSIAKQFDPSIELKYNKFYIGLARNGQPSNFIVFRPKKGFIRLEPRLKELVGTQERLEAAGLDVMDYDSRRGRYRIRLQPGEVEKQKQVLVEVIKEALAAAND